MKPILSPCVLLCGAALSAAATRDMPRLTGVSERMEKFIDQAEVAGAVTLVADADKTLHLAATGMADVAAGRVMKPDDVFWIASMTKPVTATAVMMMQEEGRLSVDDPVAKHLPEFRDLKDAKGRPVSVTIAQCLTHTCGLAEAGPAESRDITTLAALMPLIATQPVQFAPGSRWAYCQSGINTAARIVEVVSGQSFPEFLDARLFGPLGMKDTTFYPNTAQIARLAVSYRSNGNALEAVPIPFFGGKTPADRDRYPMANGGLFSTADDYARFGRMIVRGGELDGRRYLRPESVKHMTTVQSGDLQTGFTPGNAWGLGWCVIRKPQGVSAALSPGSFGHGGMFGTQAWIDPVKRRVHLLLVQRANFANSDASPVRQGFHEAVAATLP